jgi:hypothetical protein
MPTGDPEAGKGGQQSGGYGGDEGNLGDAQEGQASPDGNSFGSPSGDHPDNDPSTGLSYGSNQTEADLNFQDLDAVENAMRSVAIDVDYSAYDKEALKELNKNTETFNNYDYRAFKSKVDEFGWKQGAYDPNATPLETAQFDMDALNAHLQSQNKTAPAISQVDSFSTFDDQTNPFGPYGHPAPHLGALLDAGPNVETPGFKADVESFDAAKNISLDTPATSPATSPTTDLEMDAKERALKQALGYDKQLGLQGFTEAQLEDVGKEIRALPTRQQQLEALKEFYAKYELQIEQHKKNWAKEHPINPAIPGLGMMGSALAGLLGKMGIDPQINSPALDALEQHARTLGLFDKESGEITEADMMQTCNATTGYIWNAETKTCDAISPSGEEAYNPYAGII